MAKKISLRRALLVVLFICFSIVTLAAQAPIRLTLEDAKMMAINNHPQVLAAQALAAYTNQQVVASRAPYFPTFSVDVTGTEGNELARVGAGGFSATRLFNRFGQGVLFSQLV